MNIILYPKKVSDKGDSERWRVHCYVELSANGTTKTSALLNILDKLDRQFGSTQPVSLDDGKSFTTVGQAYAAL